MFVIVPKVQVERKIAVDRNQTVPAKDTLSIRNATIRVAKAEDLTSRCSRTRPREPPPISADTRRGERAGSEGN